MTDREMIDKAEKLMIDAHHNRTRPGNRLNEKGYQVDKAGVDYIYHPLAVAKMCDDPKEKVVALLHDVLEDTYVTEEELRNNGFEEEIIDAIRLVTHKRDASIADDEEEYKTYIRKLKETGNQIAINVKIADLTHNSDISRTSNKPTRKTEWYKWALNHLKEESKVPIIISDKLEIYTIRIMSESGYEPESERFADDFRVTRNRIQYESTISASGQSNEWFYDVESLMFNMCFEKLCSVIFEMIEEENSEATVADSDKIDVIAYFGDGTNQRKTFYQPNERLSGALALIRNMIPPCEEDPLFLEWEKNECSDEVLFNPMKGTVDVRPAQIPIKKTRFEELTKGKWSSPDEKWVVFCHHDHLMIYSTETKSCVFDVVYLELPWKKRIKDSEDPIVAVIIRMFINQEANQRPNSANESDDLHLLISLVNGEK